MAKDPAFLFYPGDWLGGTLTFTRSHKGAYMDLLMAQFSVDHMSLDDIQTVLGEDFEIMWESKLKAKFIQDDAGLYYNEKLEFEKNKRKNFTSSRKNNLKNKDHKGSHMDAHMENGNEIENIIRIKIGGLGERKFNRIDLIVLLNEWRTRYHTSRKNNYTNPNEDRDIIAIGSIIILYEKKYPGRVSNLSTLGIFFKDILGIQDKWWRANITPSLLVKKFDEACGMIDNNQPQRYSYSQITELITKQGRKQSEFECIKDGSKNYWIEKL